MMSFRYSLQNFEQSGAIRKLISKLTKASQLSEQGIIILGSGFESLSRYHVSPTTDCFGKYSPSDKGGKFTFYLNLELRPVPQARPQLVAVGP